MRGPKLLVRLSMKMQDGEMEDGCCKMPEVHQLVAIGWELTISFFACNTNAVKTICKVDLHAFVSRMLICSSLPARLLFSLMLFILSLESHLTLTS